MVGSCIQDHPETTIDFTTRIEPTRHFCVNSVTRVVSLLPLFRVCDQSTASDAPLPFIHCLRLFCAFIHAMAPSAQEEMDPGPLLTALPVYPVNVVPQQSFTWDWAKNASAVVEEKEKPTLPPKVPRRQQASARPSCTHVVMDRVFNTLLTCQVCNRVPSVGWIYVCQQDNHPPSNLIIPKPRKKSTKTKKRTVAEDLQSLGFNKSIIKAAEAGLYSTEQLDTLKQQRAHLREVIESAMKEEEILRSKNGPAPDVLSLKLVQLQSNTATEPDERKQTLVTETKQRPAPERPMWSKPAQHCEFHVCHTCRPFSRDRSYTSFENTFSHEDILPTFDPALMPVANAALLSRMDWVPKTKQGGSSAAESDTDSTPSSSIPSRPRSAISNRGFRQSLEKSYRALVEDGDSSEIAMEMEKNKHDRSQNDFDLNLWKKMMQGVQAIASATRLPGRDSEDSLTPTFDDGLRIGRMNGQEFIQAEGVAVTEEAIETKTPDLILGV